MMTIESTVQNGMIRLPGKVHLRNGSRVLITVLEAEPEKNAVLMPIDLEQEDVAFVSACKGRLAKHVIAEESNA